MISKHEFIVYPSPLKLPLGGQSV
ncbi:hypothetical protein Rin_00022770, partial [Candidatus Regiella insecticola 5.15]